MKELTALVLTRNEEANIERTLRAIGWIDRVVIVDSFSSDRTHEIARKTYPNVEILQREFDSFAAQCNFGLSNIDSEWTLSLDADYVLQESLSAEIRKLIPVAEVSGYSAKFIYCINGHSLRSTVYPRRIVLYRTRLAEYRDEGHGHRVAVKGLVERLNGKIYHDDRKSFRQWLDSQKKYATIEATYLRERAFNELNGPDRLRRMIFFAAPVMFFYTLFVRRLILDGIPGWIYVLQRTIAEMLLSKELLFGRHRQ